MKDGQTETVASDEMTLMSDEDVYLFNEGTHFHLYRKLGAHPVIRNGMAGTLFSVWAPNAEQVSVHGSFNDWKKVRTAYAAAKNQVSGRAFFRESQRERSTSFKFAHGLTVTR